MNELVTYLLNEEYDFELKGNCDGNNAHLSIPLFGGTLNLVSDGTWSYEED